MDLRKTVADPWVWGQTALMILVAFGAPLVPRHINLGEADFMLNRIDPLRIRVAGGLILAGGIFWLIWGLRSLGRNLTPGVEPLPDSDLVTSGAYARVRHPIYTGLVLTLAGYTMVWSNWTLALIVGLVGLWYFNAKARAEEHQMLQRFTGYAGYMRHVPRRVL